MKKINIIKESRDFTRIIKKRNGISNKLFIINKEFNNTTIPKFGITFTKNIGNTVTRNSLKRKVKSIIDNNKNIYQNNQNYIIIIKKEATSKNYQELEISLLDLFHKIKEKNNEKQKN